MNLFALSRTTMKTSVAMITTPQDIFTPGGVRQSTPQSAVVVTTPPVFAGITGVTPKIDGSMNVQWASATSTNTPHLYEVYVSPGAVSPAVLFALQPALLADNDETSIDLMKLADQSTYFVSGQVYTFGVRCRDRLGNQNSNLVVLQATAIASGNLPALWQTLLGNYQSTQTALDGNVTQLDSDLTRFETDLSQLEGDLTQFEGDLATMSSNTTALENVANDIADSATSISSSTSTIVAAASSIEASASDLDQSVTDLDSLVSSLAASFVQFQADLSQMEGDISDLNALVVSMQSTANDLDTLAASLNLLASTLAAIVVPPQVEGFVTSGSGELVGIVEQQEEL